MHNYKQNTVSPISIVISAFQKLFQAKLNIPFESSMFLWILTQAYNKNDFACRYWRCSHSRQQTNALPFCNLSDIANFFQLLLLLLLKACFSESCKRLEKSMTIMQKGKSFRWDSSETKKWCHQNFRKARGLASENNPAVPAVYGRNLPIPRFS